MRSRAIVHFPRLCVATASGKIAKFVDKYMPALGGFLHYRLLDVSAIKTVAIRFAPDKQFKKPTASEHDALYDIRNSIAEFRHYTQKLFNF